MSLADWHKNGWLRPHRPSKEEIANLLEIVERDLKAVFPLLWTPAQNYSENWSYNM
jgi:hypothetical protein